MKLSAKLVRVAGITSIMVAVLTTVGCHGFLVPHRNLSMPATEALTRDGDKLVAVTGTIGLRHGDDDLGSLLGVTLAGDDEGVTVESLLRTTTPLRAGDRLVALAPFFGAGTAPSGSPNTGKETLTSLEDISGYGVASDSMIFNIEVERAGKRLPIRVETERKLPLEVDMKQSVWSIFDDHGFETLSLNAWPAGNLPLHGGADDFLVVRVAVDSPAARAGLRPLDVIVSPGGDRETLLTSLRRNDLSVLAPEGRAIVAHADGGRETVILERYQSPTDLWIPFLLSYETDGRRTHIGVGPLDVIYHYSSRDDYDHSTDEFVKRSRWSFLTCINSGETGMPSGRQTFGGVALLLDPVRTMYTLERLEQRTDSTTFRSSPIER